jgi:glutamate formiminotransferase
VKVLECVVNVSEGRDTSLISSVVAAGGDQVLDVHNDPDHHRAVITLGGDETEDAARAVARRTVELVDIRHHRGVHPRMGALDVVPFVPLGPEGSALFIGDDLTPALAARDRFARWAAQELALPCFCYGPERTLPEVRRRAFVDLEPETGLSQPHPTAGACAVGARFALVAYNLWLSTSETQVARAIARELRGPGVRALGFAAGGITQVSCNLVDPVHFGPARAYDAVNHLAHKLGVEITRAELIGLVPAHVIASTPPERHQQLDLDPEHTIEARLTATPAT